MAGIPRPRGARPDEPFNINIHYDGLLASLVPPGSRVLDVGCGDGFLAARLARNGCRVTALDVDADVLGRAQARWPDLDVAWLRADVMTHAFGPEPFDAVVSNATLHHLPDPAAALRRLGSLVAPGGVVGVVAFARNGLLDWPQSLLGAAAIRAVYLWRPKWEHTAPIAWPPPSTYGQVRDASGEALPGRHYRRLWLGRYLVTWRRPPAG